MTGQELWQVRDWVMERVDVLSREDGSDFYPLSKNIVDILNDEIKWNILTVRIPEADRLFSDREIETFEGLVRNNRKIGCIKIVRAIFGWGLKDSKEWVEERMATIWAPIAGLS